ncbi:MAG: cytochrome B [Methylocystis sp.]|nr:MAG: cytochrome B [Methylocystis sp.]
MSDSIAAGATYSPASRAFHWASALFVIGAWTLGLLGDELPRGPMRHAGEFAHVLLGQFVLLLLVLRIVWRFVTPPPPAEPSPFGLPGELASRLGQFAIYALLFSVPIVGLVTLFHGGETLPLLGVYDIPSPWPRNRELKHYSKEIHELLAHMLIVIATLHAAAALAHHYFLRDGTLRRMLPFLPSPR